MEKQHENPTKENKTEKCTNGEMGNNGSYEIAEEIMLLLNDYFCGNFTHDTAGILMKLNDGKVFRLSIAEVA